MDAAGYSVKTPVVLTVFNRPDTTRRVFEAIRAARPPVLLVVADAPRANRPGEAERCAEALRLLDAVDWPCEVLRHVAPVNLGPRRRLSSGLTWAFDAVQEAIVLEHDCLPDPSFFRFCDELLERFRKDEQVAVIGGNNFQFGRQRTPYSYYFSRYPHIWGWASWRRTWRHYDPDIGDWPAIREAGRLREWLGNFAAVDHWSRIFDRVHRGEIDTWDYQLTLSCWARGALSVVPAVNLVSNIGFGSEAVHTRELTELAEMKATPLPFPLSHPSLVLRDAVADAFTEKRVYEGNPGRTKIFRRRIWRFLREILGISR